MVVSHTAVAGTIDRRDIEVEVYIAGKLVKQDEWDDIYYVKKVAPPPEEADIKDVTVNVTYGTYDIGVSVPFTVLYDYKGPAQGGQLTISIGTGLAPHFSTKYTYAPTPIRFEAAADWTRRRIDSVIVLPDGLEPGQEYNVKAKLETLAVITEPEDDVDWSAFKVSELAPPPPPELEFSLTRPYVPQAPIYPGTAIDIHCPVTLVSGEAQTRLYAIVKIYEGSFWPGHGALLSTKQTPFFSLAPGETKEIIIRRTAIAGTIDRRDVEVEIYLAGELLKESEWDDIYYVEEKPVAKYMLTVTVYGMYPGYVTVTPGGKVTTTGSFYYDAGTRVTLTAVGGSFLRWIIDTEWQAYGVRTTTITMNRNMEAIAGFE
ncbi:hypothetical protein ES703_102627 [subsurface metagenome]